MNEKYTGTEREKESSQKVEAARTDMFGVVFVACDGCKEERIFPGNQHHHLYDWEYVVHTGHRTHLGLLWQVHKLPVSHYLAREGGKIWEGAGKSIGEDSFFA